ncbi:uncharacterized protein Tco025E_10316 [Trypanosoma conorhini]|uniref:Uncharacterized protein n=1 Tax=Trypanosoma conorhini TaxID=83891 RepID=A0A422MNM2_9TRYP|nr:uncharacterized protein Tco025E_10316 [Trypanosoma conorhini]RNE94815.1 hypothetical protein Tco025E_10316 [Trypanosoma conorhini]
MFFMLCWALLISGEFENYTVRSAHHTNPSLVANSPSLYEEIAFLECYTSVVIKLLPICRLVVNQAKKKLCVSTPKNFCENLSSRNFQFCPVIASILTGSYQIGFDKFLP